MEATSRAHDLIGTWKLQSMQFEFEDSRERVDLYGPNPLGYMILTENERVMVLVTASGRVSPNNDTDNAGLFNTMMSYSGTYRVEDDRFIARIDVAWHPGWMNTDQIRSFRREGDQFSITTDTQTHPMFGTRRGKGVITWSRT